MSTRHTSVRLSPTLGRLVASRPPRPAQAERCEFCTVDIPAAHGHVVDLNIRVLLCACRPCYLLFLAGGAARGRYRSVPDRYEALVDTPLAGTEWDALQIPVGMAAIFLNSSLGRAVALYPSPVGATESLLPLEAWSELVGREPRLSSMDTDVEAVLVRRTGSGPRPQPAGQGALECYIVPIDACYELAGRLRRSWRGFQGGDEAWRDVNEFFAQIRHRCGIAPMPVGGAA